jgi:hypothetical protein
MFGKEIKIETDLFSSKYNCLLDSFDCGNQEINKFLRKAEGVCNDGYGVTRIVIDVNENKIIGFYTLACSSLLYGSNEQISGLPAVEIKMFAVDKNYQDLPYFEDDGIVLSDYILDKVIKDIYELSSSTIGAAFIVLHAVPESVEFYKRSRFEELEEFMKPMHDNYTEGCIPMYLKL